jgi:hypothetical protein
VTTGLHCSTCCCAEPREGEAWVVLGNGRRISLGSADALDAFLREIVSEESLRRLTKCSLCSAAVLVHDDGSTTGGSDTLVGIRCDRCLNAPAGE